MKQVVNTYTSKYGQVLVNNPVLLIFIINACMYTYKNKEQTRLQPTE